MANKNTTTKHLPLQQYWEVTKSIRQSNMKKDERALLRVLLDHADSEYKCWPSLSTLCTESGMSKSTVTGTLNSLEIKMVITRQKRPSKSKGNMSTMYFIKPLAIESLRRGGSPHTGQGSPHTGQGSPHTGQGSPHTGHELVHRTNPLNYKDLKTLVNAEFVGCESREEEGENEPAPDGLRSKECPELNTVGNGDCEMDNDDTLTLGELIDVWNNKIAPLGLPYVASESRQRRYDFNSRVSENPARATKSYWGKVFTEIVMSDFLMGRMLPKNGRTPFKISLPKLLSDEEMMIKIEECFYRNKVSNEDMPVFYRVDQESEGD